MAPKKKGKGKSSRKLAVDPNAPVVPPLHELWDLHMLHDKYEERGVELEQTRALKNKL
jgi:hypothetical protein